MLVVLFLFISSTAYASDICANLSTMATSIMEARQMGLPINTLLQAVETGAEGDATMLEISTTLVLEAYETPKYSTEPMKEEAATEFGNKMYIECAKHNI
jgi:hypothetical protein